MTNIIKALTRGFLGFATLSFIFFFSFFVFHYFSLPLPPALIGIFILFIALVVLRRVPKFISESARPLLTHMGLFLVPALISVMLYADVFSDYLLALISAILISTLLSLAITLWLSQRILANVKVKSHIVAADKKQ